MKRSHIVCTIKHQIEQEQENLTKPYIEIQYELKKKKQKKEKMN